MRGRRTSEDARRRFFDEFARSANARRAAAAAGIAYPTLANLRARDAAFAASWEAALEAHSDRLQEAACLRAFDGTRRPRVVGGKLVRDAAGEVFEIHHYNNRLLLALLRACRPAKFAKRVGVKQSGAAEEAPVLTVAIDEDPSVASSEAG
jgi:hypothetical protein